MLLIQVTKGLRNQRRPGARLVVHCWGTYDTVLYTGPPLSGKVLNQYLNRRKKMGPIIWLLQNIRGCMRLLNHL